jgi:hypothetical protein
MTTSPRTEAWRMYILSELSLARKHISKRMHTAHLCTRSQLTTIGTVPPVHLFQIAARRYPRLSHANPSHLSSSTTLNNTITRSHASTRLTLPLTSTLPHHRLSPIIIHRSETTHTSQCRPQPAFPNHHPDQQQALPHQQPAHALPKRTKASSAATPQRKSCNPTKCSRGSR